MAQANHNYDIPIGNNEVIKWVDFDMKNAKIEYIDDEILPLKALFDGLELACVRGCCGIEAFSFKQELIHETATQLNLKIKDELDNIIDTIESKTSEVVGSIFLNQYFVKSVFVNLLKHMKQALPNP